MEQSLFIAGTAGEGIQTIGDVVAQTFLRHGYHVFTLKEYESRIRGGNSSYRIRVSDRPLNAPRHSADILLALNPRAEDHYAATLVENGQMLGPKNVPFGELADETGGSALYANSVAAGALCAAVGLPFATLKCVLHDAFARKGTEIVSANVSAARAGFAKAQEVIGDQKPESLPLGEAQVSFSSAHETIPLAAAAAGCRFMAAYPMSPSTGIITAFARDPELGVFVEQAEDEIAAINMCLGASAAGARAITATSGGGFALMAEGISLSGMTETPIVILLAQRPGPATGLPTRTAQEDLNFALHAGHGEFARVLLAPSDPQDAIQLTVRAFDLASRYQIPVILLTDQLLADAHFSLPALHLPEELPRETFAEDAPTAEYARYELTEDGLSPRRYLGQGKQIVCIDSDEHTENGHITEDLASIRPAMVEKRLKRKQALMSEMSAPAAYRVEDAELVLIGWGSTRGALTEAVDRLRDAGRAVGLLHFTELWPLPPLNLDPDRRYIVVEGNATGQFASLLRAEAHVPVDTVIGRFDGFPLDAETIVGELS